MTQRILNVLLNILIDLGIQENPDSIVGWLRLIIAQHNRQILQIQWFKQVHHLPGAT